MDYIVLHSNTNMPTHGANVPHKDKYKTSDGMDKLHVALAHTMAQGTPRPLWTCG